ncbi:unnamed protein product [Amoebophrya sp. A120]|nr:unnamed protein product [Amoebophrya sp. A120]|eukprot:GSA120T00025698001.1
MSAAAASSHQPAQTVVTVLSNNQSTHTSPPLPPYLGGAAQGNVRISVFEPKEFPANPKVECWEVTIKRVREQLVLWKETVRDLRFTVDIPTTTGSSHRTPGTSHSNSVSPLNAAPSSLGLSTPSQRFQQNSANNTSHRSRTPSGENPAWGGGNNKATTVLLDEKDAIVLEFLPQYDPAWVTFLTENGLSANAGGSASAADNMYHLNIPLTAIALDKFPSWSGTSALYPRLQYPAVDQPFYFQNAVSLGQKVRKNNSPNVKLAFQFLPTAMRSCEAQLPDEKIAAGIGGPQTLLLPLSSRDGQFQQDQRLPPLGGSAMNHNQQQEILNAASALAAATAAQVEVDSGNASALDLHRLRGSVAYARLLHLQTLPVILPAEIN